MKKLNLFFLVAFVTITTFSKAERGAAPSMHLGGSFSSDAVLKMQKVKITQSRDASFFEVNNFTNGYCGLQQTPDLRFGDPNLLIASLWDTNTAAGIYAAVDYIAPTTMTERFGGEGDGAKTVNPYKWTINTWYNVVHRSWKSKGRLIIATYINNLTTSKWFHTSTLSIPDPGRYLGSSNDAFLENWTGSDINYDGGYVRQMFLKDCFYLNTAGNWGKYTQVTFSANDSPADVTRNGIYHNSFNAYYDATEDAYCMLHGGNTVRSAAFNGGRTLTLPSQARQTAVPVLTQGTVSSVTASYNAGTTTVNWENSDVKSPQLSAKVEILNASGTVILTQQDTVPQKRSFTTTVALAAGTYTTRVTIRDIFNQLSTPVTTSFTVQGVAQLPEISTTGNEIWYYVLNQRGWTMGSPLTTTAMNGTASGVELTTSSPKYNNYAQQWKIVENGGTGNYQMINRSTSLSIDLNCKSNSPEANVIWKLIPYSGTTTFPGYRIISTDGTVGIHARDGRVFPYNAEAAECFWVFVKSSDMTFKQPTNPIEYSNGTTKVWYSIKTPGRASANYLTANNVGNTITGTAYTGADAQLWKVIDSGNGSVNIVSKLNSGQIKIPTANSVEIPLTSSTQSWILDYQDSEQYHIVGGTYQLHLTASSKLVAYPGASLGDASCWIFNKIATTTPNLSISATKLTVSALANSTATFNITSNTNWIVTSNQSWLSVSNASGSGNATIILTANLNPTETVRTAIINVSGQDVTTKTITVTQNGNEIWYYVLNQRGWISGVPLLTTAMTGTALGVELTTSTPVYNNYAQQWKKVLVTGSATEYLLINRATGLSIDASCKANNPAANYSWHSQAYSGTTAFPGFRIISTIGTVGIHAGSGRVFPYNAEAAECFWTFIKSSDMTFKQPTTPIEYSSTSNVWYSIKTPGRASENYLTANSIGSTVTGTAYTGADAQLWKVIDLGDGSVNIINKSNNGQITLPVANSVDIPLTSSAQSWMLDYQDSEQYHIVGSTYQLHLTAGRKLVAYPGASLGDASCWIFNKVLTTAKSAVKGALTSTEFSVDLVTPSIKVYVNEGLIQVIGTDEKPQVYTISGQNIDAHKPLSKGIYIVKVARIIQKVIVY